MTASRRWLYGAVGVFVLMAAVSSVDCSKDEVEEPMLGALIVGTPIRPEETLDLTGDALQRPLVASVGDETVVVIPVQTDAGSASAVARLSEHNVSTVGIRPGRLGAVTSTKRGAYALSREGLRFLGNGMAFDPVPAVSDRVSDLAGHPAVDGLWVAEDGVAVHVDEAGRRVPTDPPVRGSHLAADAEGGVWVAGDDAITHVGPDGRATGPTVSLDAPAAMAVEGQLLWVVSGRRADSLRVSAVFTGDGRVVTSWELRDDPARTYVRLHVAKGIAWATDGTRLYRFDFDADEAQSWPHGPHFTPLGFRDVRGEVDLIGVYDRQLAVTKLAGLGEAVLP